MLQTIRRPLQDWSGNEPTGVSPCSFEDRDLVEVFVSLTRIHPAQARVLGHHSTTEKSTMTNAANKGPPTQGSTYINFAVLGAPGTSA